MAQIPSSQLPPNRSVPTSQLLQHSPVSTITQKVTGLNINQATGTVNPRFSTSTPNAQSPISFRQNGSFSPIAVPNKNVLGSGAKLESVPLTSSSSSSTSMKTITNSITTAYQSNHEAPQVTTSSKPTDPAHQFQASSSVQHQGPSSQFNVNPILGIGLQKNLVQQNSLNPLQRPQMPTQSNSQNYQPQVSVDTVNQSGQNYVNRGVYPKSNPPAESYNYQNLQNYTPTSNIPSHLLLSQNNNQNALNNQLRQSNVPFPTNKPYVVDNQLRSNIPSNLQQPPMSQNSTPVTSQNFMPPKPSMHSNRYPTPTNANFQQQQSNTTSQWSNQLYSNRNPLQPQQMSTTPSSNTYVQSQSTYPGHLQNTYNQPHTTHRPLQSEYQGVTQSGFNKMWGMEHCDLLQIPNILPEVKEPPPQISLGHEVFDQANCSPDIFRCTMTKIPENNSLLQKSRLPLGVLIHPFRDLNHLPVIQCNVIVRCRACRTYINPFVLFVDSKRWKCNLCYRINELPEEFQYDPVSKTYGDPSRRPEIKSSTIEYIAPAEYMLRPPQPAVYLFLLDISRLAIESGYLHSVSRLLLEELKNLPGDARTQIGFVAYDSALHFFSFAEGLSRPHEMTILDIEDVFLPTPDNLLVNLRDKMELVSELLSQLPTRYNNTFDNNSALGSALQVSYKLMMATGGRVTVFQAALPNVGPGALTVREDPSQRTSAEVSQLNPANDFYKRLALECSGQQIAVDLFIINSTYVDIATISGISRFSGGCIHHFPLYKMTKILDQELFEKSFRRYLLRKIGFEAVMRIRCTRGLSVHTFHGNFFVRSTDLLSLPNINPDAGFGMQVAIEESLSDVQTVCFQAALLYTSSKGERRIRVHTMCLPVASSLQDIIHSADQQCIIGLLAKMAVDRSMQSSLADAREAFINVAIDILTSYRVSQNLNNPVSGLIAPTCLKLLPLYISALLKYAAFRTGTNTRLDDRVKAMIDMKTKPLYILIQMIYPDLYPVHNLENQRLIQNVEEENIPMPPRLHLSSRCLDSKGAFLLDMGERMVMMVLSSVPSEFLNEALGVASYDAIPDQMYEIPILNNPRNQRLHQFINYLNEEKPFAATVQVIRDNSPNRVVFLEQLIEDRVENALSYHEFLQHLKTQVK
ncbi:hypothetical protein NQ315_014190 [Exocentrus adspersus]|uniref:Protein transport protein Sec24A n=1 Tax=Exocentrus adspersus TaxID=1586481 RepID=A0AAV8VBE1_9CUCU|nr:hypothetical protein NQ315_014190 [Exocentrus adspersus]